MPNFQHLSDFFGTFLICAEGIKEFIPFLNFSQLILGKKGEFSTSLWKDSEILLIKVKG